MTTARHCLVTGANRGLGLEFVHQLLAAGDRVIATCRHPGRANALNTLTGEYPGRLHVLPLDLAEPRSHAELARELPLVLGDNGRLDLLVNNAGVLHSGERFGHIEPAQLHDSLRVNAAGPFLFTQALAPLLADGGAGRGGAVVVNLSSRLGSIAGVDGFNTPTYAMSKAALNMATVLLAQALADRGITVLAVSPGWVRTDMGGTDAPLEAPVSVAGLLEQARQATPADSGRFIDYRGEGIDW